MFTLKKENIRLKTRFSIALGGRAVCNSGLKYCLEKKYCCKEIHLTQEVNRIRR